MSSSNERFPLTASLKGKREDSGFRLTIGGFVVISIAITAALIVHIQYGAPEVEPHAAVASDHSACSLIGNQVLLDGGSAVDTAVATALCMVVVHPHAAGLGSGGFMLVHQHVSNKSTVFDFRESAPTAAQLPVNGSTATGGTAVGVPGLLRGLQLAHARYGRLSWSRLVTPSVQLASRGVNVSRSLAAALRDHMTVDRARAAPGMSVFITDDRLLEEGDVLYLPELAGTLEIIQSEGADALYNGSLSDSLVAALSSAGSSITRDDLHNYTALEYTALIGRYNGRTVVTSGAPSGGPALLLALSLAEQLQLASSSSRRQLRAAESTETWYRSMLGMVRLSHVGHSKLGDPATAVGVNNRTQQILSAAYVAQLAALASSGSPTPQLSPLAPPPTAAAASHVAIIDAKEMYVSLVSGLGSLFGAQVRSSGGVMFSNAMSSFYPSSTAPLTSLNTPAPGRRPLSTYTPAVVMDDQPCAERLVTGGSDGTLVAQLLLAMVNNGFNISSAIEAARLHATPDSLQVDVEFEHPVSVAGSVLERLDGMGYGLRNTPPPYPSFNAILKRLDSLSSHSDSRGGGTAFRF